MNEKGISLVQLRQRKTRQTAALFLAPVIILLVVFIAYPIIDTFITSGYQWNGISADKKMVGLANWAKLIKDTKFWIAFKNNVIIMILSIIIQIPLGLAMATFLDFGGKKLTIFKVIWFIPMLMSSVAIGFLFTYALATNGGIAVSYTHLRAHETDSYLVCRLLLEKKKAQKKNAVCGPKLHPHMNTTDRVCHILR